MECLKSNKQFNDKSNLNRHKKQFARTIPSQIQKTLRVIDVSGRLDERTFCPDILCHVTGNHKIKRRMRLLG